MGCIVIKNLYMAIVIKNLYCGFGLNIVLIVLKFSFKNNDKSCYYFFL